MKSQHEVALTRAAQQPRGFDRRGFLRRAAAMTGGLGAAALLKPGGAAAPAAVLLPGARAGEPYFFRIEAAAGRPVAGAAVKEV